MQFMTFSKEFLVVVIHQVATITSLPFVRTGDYPLLLPIKWFSEASGSALSGWQWLDTVEKLIKVQTWSFKF
jgi:hypothetical protein